MRRFGEYHRMSTSYSPEEQVDPLALLNPFTTDEKREAFARAESAAGLDGIELKTLNATFLLIYLNSI